MAQSLDPLRNFNFPLFFHGQFAVFRQIRSSRGEGFQSLTSATAERPREAVQVANLPLQRPFPLVSSKISRSEYASRLRSMDPAVCVRANAVSPQSNDPVLRLRFQAHLKRPSRPKQFYGVPLVSEGDLRTFRTLTRSTCTCTDPR